MTQIQIKDATRGAQAFKSCLPRRVDICTQIFWTRILKRGKKEKIIASKREARSAWRELRCLLWTVMLSSVLNSEMHKQRDAPGHRRIILSRECARRIVISCCMYISGMSLWRDGFPEGNYSTFHNVILKPAFFSHRHRNDSGLLSSWRRLRRGAFYIWLRIFPLLRVLLSIFLITRSRLVNSCRRRANPFRRKWFLMQQPRSNSADGRTSRRHSHGVTEDSSGLQWFVQRACSIWWIIWGINIFPR